MKKTLDALEKAITFLCGILLIGIMILIAAQVFTRYALHNALTWSEHAARGLFIWMIMLYAGVLIRNAGNLGFDLLAKALPKSLSDIFNLLCELLIFAFSVYWLTQGAVLCRNFAHISFPDLKMPYWTIYSAEPVGAFLIAVFSAEAFVKRMKSTIEERRAKKC